MQDPASFEDSRRHSYTELDDTGGGVKREATTVYTLEQLWTVNGSVLLVSFVLAVWID